MLPWSNLVSHKGKPRSGWRRRAGALALVVCLLAVALTVVLRVRLSGQRLADTVEDLLNDRIRGRVEIGTIDWRLADLGAVLVGGWATLTIRDLAVYDEFGELVLETPLARASLDVHPALLRQDLVLRDIELPSGGYALLKQVSEPYPAHQYDDSAVSLVSAFYTERSPGFHAGVTAGAGNVFDLQSYRLEGATLEFRFPEFTAVAEEVSADGFLYYDGRDPIASKLFYSLTPRAARGTVSQGPVAIALEDIRIERLAQVPLRWPREMLPRDLEYRATARSGSTTLRLDGRLIDSWIDIFGGEHDITLDVEGAGPLAAVLSGDVAGGEDLRLRLRVTGPTLAPRVRLELEGLALHLDVGGDEPLDLAIERAVAGFDLATDAGTLEDTIATGAGGKVELSASFQLAPTSFDLHVDILEPIELAPYLPGDVTRLAGSQLSGSLHAFGNQQVQRLGGLDLRLGDAQVTGEAYRTAEGAVHADGVEVTLRGTKVSGIAGRIDAATGELDLDFTVVSRDLRRWLREARAPALASGLRARVHVGGTLSDPSARASLTARGVPIVERLDTQLRYQDQRVTVSEAEAAAFGGWLRGSAAVVLGDAPRIEGAEAQGVNLRLDRLPFVGALLSGELDVRASASGRADRPDAALTAALSGWSVAGEAYRDTELRLESDDRGGRRLRTTLERVLGGSLAIDASADGAGGLDGGVSLSSLPIDGLFALGGAGGRAEVGGDLEADLRLGGTLDRPTVEGHARLLRSWLRDAFFGTAEIGIEPVEGGFAFRAALLQGRVVAHGTLGTAAPYPVDATVDLRRLEIDRFLPELAERHHARAWVSGRLRWRGPLLESAGKPEVTAELTEAVLLVDGEDHAGRPAPLRVRNESALSLSFDGDRVVLREPAIFHGPTGRFTATGAVSGSGFDLGLSGRVAVELLQPHLQRQFEEMAGDLAIEARVTGPLDTPRVTGVLEIEDVALKPVGQDAIVTVPAGKIDFSNDQLAVTGLSLVVVDEFSDDRSELRISGGVRLDEFVPTLWAVRVDGELAGKMLLAVAPQAFSAAGGSAEISIALLGVGAAPDIDGTIEFSPEGPLTITPRGLRRELAFTGGAIRFTDKLIELEELSGWVDDEGQITDVSGEVSLVDWRPIDVDVSVSARDLPFRVPGELEMTMNLRDLQVIGGAAGGLEVAGEIEVVDGRYVRKFNPVIDALQPARSTETSGPFYEGVPLLADARLNLVLSTRSFFVRNNVASIDLSGEVEVTGTPADPRFAGVVRVEQGSFKFQGVRAKFERTSGMVSFSPYREFPENTPTLDLRSESNYRDIGGQDHLVQLTLRGPLSNLDWDLSTAAGLNKAQTLTLIFAGRTPDDAREALLGDEPIGRAAGSFEGTRSTESADSTFQVADQLVKDLAGDFFSLLIEDRLRDVTGLDVARIQVGTASVGFHAEKDITKSMRFVFEVERTLRGWSWDGRGQYRINDTWSVDGEYLQKRFDDDAEEDENQGRGKVTWRWLIP